MNKKDPLQTAITGWQKIALMFLGLFLSLVLLEAGLRLGGFVLRSMQEYGNLQSIKQKGAYRILCLGESTTQGQYPHFLEQILNQRQTGVRFSVIDEGIAGTNSPVILSRVEPYLAEYHPDMVIAMMGINDENIKYYQDITESGSWLSRHCRVYRFGRIVCMHILQKIKHEDIEGLIGSDPERKDKTEDAGTVSEKTMISNEMPAKTAMKLDSKSAESAHLGSGWLFLEKGNLSQAENSFKKAIEINPKNDKAYVGVGTIYRDQGRFLLAEDSYRKAVAINPRNDRAYVGLGCLGKAQGKETQAEDFFKKAIEINPKNDKAIAELGSLYRQQGKFSLAGGLLREATELNLKNVLAFFELGKLYRQQGKPSQAEATFKKFLEGYPTNERVLGAIASLYEEMGKPELAREYAEKLARAGSGHCSAITRTNYRKLKDMLDKKGIKLVCIQYPMRSVEPLKRIFGQNEGVIFVDNEGIFKTALREGGYKEYFKDMFAGDFGHCTPKGNLLLAQNIADVILKEVFNR